MPLSPRSNLLAFTFTTAVALGLAWACGAAWADADAPPDDEKDPKNKVHAIAHISEAVIDADAGEWAGHSDAIATLKLTDAKAEPAPGDLEAVLWLGWDDLGLLVMVEVLDDAAVEQPGVSELYEHDSVELFLAPDRRSREKVQIIIAPGIAKNTPQLRVEHKDYRSDAKLKQDAPLKIDVAATAIGGGYRVEARIPWAVIGLKAEEDALAVAQVMVNDADQPNQRVTYVWYPSNTTYKNTGHTHRIRLARPHNLADAAPADRPAGPEA